MKFKNKSSILKPPAFCWNSLVFINMRKVSTLPNLALKALKIVPASKQKWYSFDKKELHVYLLKLHSNPPPLSPPHTHTHTRTQTQTKPSTNKPNPQISHKPAIPPTNHRQPSQIPDKPPTNRYQPKILIFFPWRHFLWWLINSGPKNRIIFHSSTLLPNPRERRNGYIFLMFLTHFAFHLLHCTYFYHH